MLNKEFTKKWIAALRSGEYEQGQGQLCDGEPTRYCCLGVACKLIKPDVFADGHSKTAGLLSTIFDPDLIGLSSQIEDRLTSMNDDENKTFGEIADYLENLINEEDTNAGN